MTSLAVTRDGTIWAGTSGGLVRWDSAGGVRVFTREHGVAGLRVRGLEALPDGALLVVADRPQVYRGGRWEPAPARQSPAESKTTGRVPTKGGEIVAMPEAGLIVLRGGKQTPFRPDPPTMAITALAQTAAGEMLIGTADLGVWRLRGGKWIALPSPPSDLPGPDATALLVVSGRLWIAPREGPAFQSSGKRAVAQGAPWRQAIEWNSRSLVRRADGRLAEVDGQGRESPSGLRLPRTHANAVAVEGDTLFVLQPGGWSEFEPGREPIHRFDVPALQGAPTTCLWADAGRLAIGTQDRGLVLIDRRTGKVEHLHEAHGLGDDWITAIAPDGSGGLLLGTFVAGLYRFDGDKATRVGLPGGCVTRLLADGDRVWVGSLEGVLEWVGARLERPAWAHRVEPDVTDLALHQGRLRIAAGGALFSLASPLRPDH